MFLKEVSSFGNFCLSPVLFVLSFFSQVDAFPGDAVFFMRVLNLLRGEAFHGL